MGFDADRWVRKFPEGSIGKHIPCGRCSNYALQGEDKLKSSKTQGSHREWNLANQGEGPTPSETWFRFVVVLRCTKCFESTIVAGNQVETDEWWGPDPDQHDHTCNLIPQFIEPAPQLFPVSKDVPDEVATALRSAFRLYWVDWDACVSRLRTAVERLLDAEGIAARFPNGGPIPLGRDRLPEYEKIQPSVAKKLEAVKWLGDTGTHAIGNVNLKSVNDGLVLISAALEERYPNRDIERLADDIISRRGRRSST